VIPLEAMDLNSLAVELEALLLVTEEFAHVLALIPLKLDHLAGFFIVDDSAIAGCCVTMS
jgi:hypothetical protein